MNTHTIQTVPMFLVVRGEGDSKEVVAVCQTARGGEDWAQAVNEAAHADEARVEPLTFRFDVAGRLWAWWVLSVNRKWCEPVAQEVAPDAPEAPIWLSADAAGAWQSAWEQGWEAARSGARHGSA